MEEKKLDWEDFRSMFHESWWLKMKPAIESDWMFEIYQKLKKDSETERILPNSCDVFKSFEHMNLNELRSLWFLQDPYCRLYKGGIPQATGIAMSCDYSPDSKIQPSLEKFYDEISRQLGKKVNYNKSLLYLQRQGIMLLNTDLTVKLNKTGSHDKLWMPFMKYLLEDILGSDNQIIHVICGKPSLRVEKHINPFCNIFKLEHPAAASYVHRDWDSQGIFKKINNILKDNNLPEIYWDYADWEEYSKSPF